MIENWEKPLFSDIQIIRGRRSLTLGKDTLDGECPNGFDVLFYKEWAGIAEGCNCVTGSMIQERNRFAAFSAKTSRSKSNEEIENQELEKRTEEEWIEIDKANKFKDDVEYYSNSLKVGQQCTAQDKSNGCEYNEKIEGVK